ncbi:unnamed protein product [Caenorhabditis brenneri]
MQFYASQAPMSSSSNSCMLKKLLLVRRIGNEPSDEYKLGGFCPINVGEVLNGEFVIIKKLGYGGFSTVWMAWHYVLQKYVALKITKSAERFMGMAEEELNFLEACTIANPNAMGANNIVQSLTEFTHVSKSGSHIAMSFEIHGPSLSDVLYHSNQKFIHLEQVRRICRQLLEAVSFLHDECGIIHSDIKPENIMVAVSDEDIQKMDPNCPTHDSFISSFTLDFTHPDSDIKIKLGDLGVSCWISKPRCPLLQTNVFRAPEVFLRGNAGTPADMWSVGCVAFELLAGRSLFTCDNTKPKIEEVINRFRQMSEIIGTIPFAPYRSEKNSKILHSFFEPDGKFISEKRFDQSLLLTKIRAYRNTTPEDAKQCADFISSILKMTPSERPTAKQALKHPFLLPYGGRLPISSEGEMFTKVEQEEEYISNSLLKKIQQLNQGKEYLVKKHQQDEESLTKSSMANVAKIPDVHADEAAEKLVADKEADIERLRTYCSRAEKNYQEEAMRLCAEKVDHESALEREQELLINTLGKRMSQMNEEKPKLQQSLETAYINGFAEFDENVEVTLLASASEKQNPTIPTVVAHPPIVRTFVQQPTSTARQQLNETAHLHMENKKLVGMCYQEKRRSQATEAEVKKLNQRMSKMEAMLEANRVEASRTDSALAWRLAAASHVNSMDEPSPEPTRTPADRRSHSTWPPTVIVPPRTSRAGTSAVNNTHNEHSPASMFATVLTTQRTTPARNERPDQHH